MVCHVLAPYLRRQRDMKKNSSAIRNGGVRWLRRQLVFLCDRVIASHLSNVLLVTGMLVLVVFSCTPVAEALFAPLDRLHWEWVVSQKDKDERDKVAVIDIDQRTITELGSAVSFSRALHAQLLSRLEGAASVVLDFMMVSTQRENVVLARAIEHHRRVVIPTQADAPYSDIVLAPAPILSRAAAAVGQRTLMMGSNYLVQGIVPYVRIGASGIEMPHIALQAIHIAGMAMPRSDLRPYVQSHVADMGQVVPSALALIFPQRFNLERYSYVDVLKGRVPASALAGKIVFVGDATSDRAGKFRLSSKSDESLSRVQIEAMVTEALLGGHVLLRVPFAVQFVVGIAVAVGMLLICMCVPGRRMYWIALLWVALFVAGVTLMLTEWDYLIPLGPTLAVCGVIYSIYGWRRANKIRSFLLKEFGELSRRVNEKRFGSLRLSPSAPEYLARLPFAGRVQHAIQQIREWQATYVDMIQTLPYPVFIEQRGKLVLSNERGRAILDTFEVHDDRPDNIILALAKDEIRHAQLSGKIRTAELTLNQRRHLMMVTPFRGGESGWDATNMISFVDIHDIKEAVENDRVTLRHMAHDLRNPLSTALTLLEERGKEGNGTDSDFLDDLHRLVEYSLRVAQDFTQLTRAEHLDARTYTLFSLSDLVIEAIDQIWHCAAAKQIRVEGPHEPEFDIFVLGNGDMMLRSLVNLLDNALKYSEPHTTVTVWIKADDHSVEIGVEDQGIGIRQDLLPHLFEPFFQVNNAAQDIRQGVGLGLPFVQAVVQRHNGTIEAASVLGQGSCFTIRLPRAVAGVAKSEGLTCG